MRRLIMMGIVVVLTMSIQVTWAQFNVSFDHDCTSGRTPLSTLCGFAGDPLPDGTNVEIFWDQNNNGPDALDEQTVVGPGFGQCNFNSFAMNGDADLGCTGGFYMTETFTISTNTPSPSRYWLRICVPSENRYWYTSSFTVIDGYQEIHIQDSSWYCVEEACGGCINPVTVSNFTASENSCSEVTLNWSTYLADQEVDSLFIYYRNTFDTLVGVVHWTATTYSYVTAPQGTRQYLIIPRRIHAPDTCFGIAAFDNGTRFPAAPGPTACFATNNLCGGVVVSWLNPSDLNNVDSFAVLRNGIEVTRQRIGLPGQANADTVFIAGAATYTVAGWNEECGLGTPSAGAAGNGAAAPATPTGVTATVEQCAIDINWVASAGANSYKIFRDGNLIQTLPSPPLNGYEPPAASTNYTFTVIASNTANPASCQDSPPSLGATGSDIDQPNAPTTVAATDSAFCTHVVVTWVDNSSNETGFIVRRDGVAIDTVAAGTVSFNDSGAVPGTNHAYTVASVNDCGPSGFISGGTGSKKQAPPTVNGTSATDNLADRVTVTWNNTIRETGYRILRNGTTLNTVAANVVTYDDMTAAAGQVYAYSVLAFGDCGDGDTSVVDSGRVLASLNPPTSVAASDTHCTIVTVTWTDNNTAPAETGHEILRDAVVIGILGANVTTFDDNTAVRGNVYSYNVRATGPGGPAISATPDNGQLAPLPGIPTLVLDSIVCTSAYLSYEAGPVADSTIFFVDDIATSIQVSAVGTVILTISAEAQHLIYAICANECGRGDTSELVSVAADLPPEQVVGVVASDTYSDRVELEWIDAIDETGYEIYRDGTLIAQIGTDEIFYADFMALPGVLHEYYVVAFNECGNGLSSDVVFGLRCPLANPPEPIVVSQGECQIVISWSNIPDETSYRVYRDGVFRAAVGADITEFVDDLALPYVNYSYTVSAVNVCDEGPQSAPLVGSRMAPPSIPSNVQASDFLCGQIQVTWQDVANEDGYLVRRNGTVIGTTMSNVTQFTDTSISGAFAYRVQAFNLCGAGFASPTDSGHTEVAPTMLSLTTSTPDCEGVSITYQATANSDTVRLYRDGGLIAELLTFSGAYDDALPLPGVYEYSAQAFGDCGASNIMGGVQGELLEYPVGPSELSVSNDSCATIRVSWVPVRGSFGYYRILRDEVELATAANSATYYDDATVVGGVEYVYTVIAVNDTCGESSVTETQAAEITLGSLPAAPDVVITTENLDAVLTWAVVDTTVEGCPIEVSRYLVYFSENGAGPFYYHGSTTQTNYRHFEVLRFASDMYYHVESFVGNVAVLATIPENGSWTRDDVMARMGGWTDTPPCPPASRGE